MPISPFTRASPQQARRPTCEPKLKPANRIGRAKVCSSQSSAARTSSCSPRPLSGSPWLRPVPRKLKRSTGSPNDDSAFMAWYTTLLCMVPPPAGCGWHTSAEYGASSRPVFNSASSRPAGPGRSSTERTWEVASDRACEPAEGVIVPSRLLRRRAGYPVLHMPIDAIDLTRKLVNIESISYHEGAAGAFLADFLAAQGYAVERMAVEQPDLARTLDPGDVDLSPGTPTPGGGEGPRFNVYAAMPGIIPDVVFSTHMDTVPPFFACTEDDEFLYGRGS